MTQAFKIKYLTVRQPASTELSQYSLLMIIQKDCSCYFFISLSTLYPWHACLCDLFFLFRISSSERERDKKKQSAILWQISAWPVESGEVSSPCAPVLPQPLNPFRSPTSQKTVSKDSLWTLKPIGRVWTGRPRGSGECGQDVGRTETAGDLFVFGGHTMERRSVGDVQGLGAEGARPPSASVLTQTQRERQRGPGAPPLQTWLGLEPVLCHWGVHGPGSRLSRSGKWKISNFLLSRSFGIFSYS